VAVPSLPPKQEIGVEVAVADSPAGVSNTTGLVTVHPALSVKVTTYVFAPRLVTVSVVALPAEAGHWML